MPSVIPLNGSAEKIADDETKRKAELLDWANKLAEAVIEAGLADADLPFLDRDESLLSSWDLRGEYDPIVDAETGQRLSDNIEESAARFKLAKAALKRLYTSALKQKWKEEGREGQQREGPRDPTRRTYGPYEATRHGVWAKVYIGGSDLYIWRRICRTRIDLEAMSRDTTRQRNWRHVYQITDETGQFEVEIDAPDLAKEANPRHQCIDAPRCPYCRIA